MSYVNVTSTTITTNVLLHNTMTMTMMMMMSRWTCFQWRDHPSPPPSIPSFSSVPVNFYTTLIRFHCVCRISFFYSTPSFRFSLPVVRYLIHSPHHPLPPPTEKSMQSRKTGACTQERKKRKNHFFIWSCSFSLPSNLIEGFFGEREKKKFWN